MADSMDTVYVVLRLPEGYKAILEELARSQSRSTTQQVQQVVKEFIEQAKMVRELKKRPNAAAPHAPAGG